jgi:hypothetical protein
MHSLLMPSALVFELHRHGLFGCNVWVLTNSRKPAMSSLFAYACPWKLTLILGCSCEIIALVVATACPRHPGTVSVSSLMRLLACNPLSTQLPALLLSQFRIIRGYRPLVFLCFSFSRRPSNSEQTSTAVAQSRNYHGVI